MKRLTIIDLDSIVYIVAYHYMEDRDVMSAISVQAETREFIDKIVDKTEAECYAGFYQKEGHSNFRLEFYPKYKANRPETPEYVKYWRPYIHEVFEDYKGITGLEVIESDDALSIFYYKYFLHYDITLSHVDKDLNCLPGRHHNSSNNKFYDVNPDMAERFFRCQVLSGDSNDNIPGLPGIGKVRAGKLIDKYISPIKAFKAFYKEKGMSGWIRNLYLNYHSIRLLHSIEELQKFTSKKEVDFIDTIDCFDYKQESVAELKDW